MLDIHERKELNAIELYGYDLVNEITREGLGSDMLAYANDRDAVNEALRVILAEAVQSILDKGSYGEDDYAEAQQALIDLAVTSDYYDKPFPCDDIPFEE